MPERVDDFGHGFFLAIGHHVHAADALDRADLLDEIDAEVAAFAGLVLRALHALDDAVGNVDARHVGAHPFAGLGGAQRPHADQDEDLLEQARILDGGHEAAQQRHVVAVLRLHELRARRDLLGEAQRRGVRRGETFGFSAAPSSTRGANVILRPLSKRCSSRSPRAMPSSDVRVEVEHGLGLRVVAGLHAVARQAQHVADAHRRAAEDVALDRDAVLVAAGDLHDRRVADARQQRADGEARHVAVGAAAVGRVDRVDVAVEHARALVDLFGIGRVRRRQLRRDGERAGAQHALETAGRGVARQDRQRIAGYRFVFELHAAAPSFSRTTRNQAEVPSRRRSTGGCSC